MFQNTDKPFWVLYSKGLRTWSLRTGNDTRYGRLFGVGVTRELLSIFERPTFNCLI